MKPMSRISSSDHCSAVRRRQRQPSSHDLNPVVDVVGDPVADSSGQAVPRVDASERGKVDVQIVQCDWRMGATCPARILAVRAGLAECVAP